MKAHLENWRGSGTGDLLLQGTSRGIANFYEYDPQRDGRDRSQIVNEECYARDGARRRLAQQAPPMARELEAYLHSLYGLKERRGRKMDPPEYVQLINRIERIEKILRDGGVIS